MDRLIGIRKSDKSYYYNDGITQIDTIYEYEKAQDNGILHKVYGKLIEKLGKLEDLMETIGTETTEELEQFIDKLIERYNEVIKQKIELKKENQELKKQPENNLPCKKDDVIYYICFPTMTVNEYKICDLKIETFTTNYQNDGWLMSEYRSSWFLTKEEAEQKLKELKGE